MELKKLFTAEERAVSPVIAVVLMIAVTVILAAVVAAFALGLGGGGESTPQASFDFDFDSGTSTLVITHEGGDTLEKAQVSVLLNGGAASASSDWPDATINTGESWTNDATASPVSSGDEIRVVFVGDDGQEATLAVYEAP